MSLEQGGHGPGERAYERELVCMDRLDAFAQETGGGAGPRPGSLPGGEGARQQQQLPAPASLPPGLPAGGLDAGLDAGLDGNPNRGATREKLFGLDAGWTQRLLLEKHRHASASGRQYFLVCPGPVGGGPGPAGRSAAALGRVGASVHEPDWAGRIKPLTRQRARRSACNRTAYKLFWVLARPGEHRDAWLAEQWIASLDSRGLSRRSAQVSALVNRYGPIMGGDRMLRCRHCLNMRYGKSPEAARKNNRRRERRGGPGPSSSLCR